MDKTGWWILIGLIPIIGFIVLIIFFLQKGDPGENSTGHRWRKASSSWSAPSRRTIPPGGRQARTYAIDPERP